MQAIKHLLGLKSKHYGVLFFLWVGLITLLSLASFQELDAEVIQIPYADKITHFVFYFGFVVLGSFWRAKTETYFNKNKVLGVLVLAIAYGGLMELLQLTFTQDRAAEWMDMLFNVSGACFAVLAVLGLNKGKEPLK